MSHNLSKSEPLSLSEIQFIEDFINKNMSSSVPKHYIKDGHFNVNLLIGLLLGSLCELDGRFSLMNGVMRFLFGNKKGEIDAPHSHEASLMKFIEYISQLSNYYVASLLDNSFNVQLLENDAMVDYDNADSSTHYHAVWMTFYELVESSFKHATLKIQAMPDTDVKARAISSFKLLEDYVTNTHAKFEDFEVFIQQFPQIVIDLYQFRFSMVTHKQALNNKHNSLPQQPHISGVKTGRNDPCFCGSGKKYKYCCINVSSTAH